MAALLELGSGFHPELSGRENVFLNGSILGLSKRDLTARFDDIVGFAGLERFIDQPVKNYSSGMYVRLGFSVAINIDPDVLLVDEVLAVGDAVFQRRCNEKFADFRRAGQDRRHRQPRRRRHADHVRPGGVAEGRRGRHRGPLGGRGRRLRRRGPRGPRRGGRRGGREPLGVGRGAADRGRSCSTAPAARSPIRPPATPSPSGSSYRAEKPIAKPVFGLALETLDGTWLWAHHTRDAGFVPDEISGEGTVDLHVPNLMLQPGTYDLSASVVDYTTTHQYDYLRRCLRFDVEHGTPRESGGYVALGGRWSSESFDA